MWLLLPCVAMRRALAAGSDSSSRRGSSLRLRLRPVVVLTSSASSVSDEKGRASVCWLLGSAAGPFCVCKKGLKIRAVSNCMYG